MEFTRLARFWFALLLGGALPLLLNGCGSGDTEAEPAGSTRPAEAETFPHYQNATLKLGREIFLGYCKLCHQTGREDAPIFARAAHWEKRLPKGADVLIRHAIEGYEGPEGTEMPARGGYSELTDEQVRAAVLYMIESVK